MTYTSIAFYVFLAAVLLFYYLSPVSMRWAMLLAASAEFYWVAYRTGWWILLGQVMLTYAAGLYIQRMGQAGGKKALFAVSVLFCVFPWLCIKNGNFILGSILHQPSVAWVVPLGISFYTLQMVSYLADIYMGKIQAQRNLAKYALYILYFPQIVQGPIPRYGELAGQLYEGHLFDEQAFSQGFLQIVWGFFLKFMIADKAAVVVNCVFSHPGQYTGCYVLVAGVLYSIELYADFMACTKICKGVSGLFGIRLAENFMRPYAAVSIRDFWRRWHMSLSGWLRDYLYIPLGGGRNGRARKYLNLVITFAASGIWHGSGYKFLFWGLLHAAYQIAGDATFQIKQRLYRFLQLPEQSAVCRMVRRAGVCFWVMLAWVIFRADSLAVGLQMVKSIFLVPNVWIFFDDSLLALGLGWKEWYVLSASIGILLYVGYRQEKGAPLGKSMMQMPFYIRWGATIAAILGIMVFGTYGFGFDAQDFIYRGF